MKVTMTIVVLVLVPGYVVPTLNIRPNKGRRDVPFTVRRITRSVGCGNSSVARSRGKLISSFLAVSCSGVTSDCSPRVISPIGKAGLGSRGLFNSFVGL